jgi:hypothetical protein
MRQMQLGEHRYRRMQQLQVRTMQIADALYSELKQLTTTCNALGA